MRRYPWRFHGRVFTYPFDHRGHWRPPPEPLARDESPSHHAFGSGPEWHGNASQKRSKSNVNSDDRIGHVLSPLGFFGGVMRDDRKARLGADRAVQVLKDI